MKFFLRALDSAALAIVLILAAGIVGSIIIFAIGGAAHGALNVLREIRSLWSSVSERIVLYIFGLAVLWTAIRWKTE